MRRRRALRRAWGSSDVFTSRRGVVQTDNSFGLTKTCRSGNVSMNIPGMFSGIIGDIRTSALFSTRLPLGRPALMEGAAIARASWAWPLAGALVGAIGAGVYWASTTAGVSTLAAAA